MTDTGVDASRAADGARDASQQLRGSRGYPILVAVGLVSYGVVHLLIAWMALQLAWGGGGGSADQSGAMATLAAQPPPAVLDRIEGDSTVTAAPVPSDVPDTCPRG